MALTVDASDATLEAILRRAIRSIVTESELGDLSGLEDPSALDAIKAALATPVGEQSS